MVVHIDAKEKKKFRHSQISEELFPFFILDVSVNNQQPFVRFICYNYIIFLKSVSWGHFKIEWFAVRVTVKAITVTPFEEVHGI